MDEQFENRNEVIKKMKTKNRFIANLKKVLCKIDKILFGWKREAVDEGLLDFSGQGRDRYGN